MAGDRMAGDRFLTSFYFTAHVADIFLNACDAMLQKRLRSIIDGNND